MNRGSFVRGPSPSLVDQSAVPSDLVRRRVREGCMIPSVSAVSKSALRALEESVGRFLPHGLTSAKRSEALSKAFDNGVPETLIVECMLSDSCGSYISEYSAAAAKSLKEAGVHSKKTARKAAVEAYWDHLCESSGLPIIVEYGKPTDKTKRAGSRRSVTAMLLYSTYGKKLLTKKPFKKPGVNSVYRKLRKDLSRAMDAVQRYSYYMRPEDPMNSSDDTSCRLEELLLYSCIMYRCLTYFMDSMDCKMLKAAGYATGLYGPRESKAPDKLFVKYSNSKSRRSARGGMSALLRLTHDSVMAVIKMCALCSGAEWCGRAGGATSAILATVDLITAVHHHCQYIINLSLVGYACWLRGGLDNCCLLSATRHQGRFCHFFGRLAPTASSHSWSAMEVGTEMWFKVAAATAMMKHGGPTTHYLQSTGLEVADAMDGKQPLQRGSLRARPVVGASNGALFVGEALDEENKLTGGMIARAPHRKSTRRRESRLSRCEKFDDLPSAKDDAEFSIRELRTCPPVTRSSAVSELGSSGDVKSTISSSPSDLAFSDDDGLTISSETTDESRSLSGSQTAGHGCWYVSAMSNDKAFWAGDGTDGRSDSVTDSMDFWDWTSREVSVDRDEGESSEDESSGDEGNATYVTMEEIEMCRLRQEKEAAGAGQEDNYMYLRGNGKWSVVPHDSDTESLYDLPYDVYDLPSFPGKNGVRRGFRASEPEYDVPRKNILARVVTHEDEIGFKIEYDVPRPRSTRRIKAMK